GDPALHGHADRGDPRVAHEHAREAGTSGTLQVEVAQHADHGPVQAVDMAPEVQAGTGEVEGEIGVELARQVQGRAAAAVDPADVDAVSPQLCVIHRDVRPASGPADADRRRVLAEHQGA